MPVFSLQGSGGSRTLSFEAGKVTDVKLEVTADDGKTTQIYLIKVKRLSAKDATLTELKINSGTLDPEFSSDVISYSCKIWHHLEMINFGLRDLWSGYEVIYKKMLLFARIFLFMF
jgi:hypothetical protein